MLTAAGFERAAAFAAENGAAQLVIVHRGEVVVDEVRHREPVDVYAVQKPLVSMMLAMAQDRGLVGLDDAVSAHLGTGWTGLAAGAESAVTIRTVLNMTTGMSNELGPLGEVGVSWRYNNIAYNYLKTLLERITGISLDALTDEWLLEPLGMSSTRWEPRNVLRPDGRAVTGLMSTAHDLARFGSMVLRGGDDLVGADHLHQIGRPGSAENPSWGLCWWNNTAAHHRFPMREEQVHPGSIIPDAPADLLAARGALENRLYVVPSLDLVVARTTPFPTDGQRPASSDRPFWASLLGG